MIKEGRGIGTGRDGTVQSVGGSPVINEVCSERGRIGPDRTGRCGRPLVRLWLRKGVSERKRRGRGTGRDDRSTTPATSYFIVYRRRPPTNSGLVAQAIHSIQSHTCYGTVWSAGCSPMAKERSRDGRDGDGVVGVVGPVVRLRSRKRSREKGEDRDGRCGWPVVPPTYQRFRGSRVRPGLVGG